jgi:hypothetical protein
MNEWCSAVLVNGKTASLIAQIRACLSCLWDISCEALKPIYLSSLARFGIRLLVESSRLEAHTDDLSSELLDTVTRIPLALQGPETTSAVICVLAKELSYSAYTPNHPCLGRHLTYAVEATLQMRHLTHDEIDAIREIAACHLQYVHFVCLAFPLLNILSQAWSGALSLLPSLGSCAICGVRIARFAVHRICTWAPGSATP